VRPDLISRAISVGPSARRVLVTVLAGVLATVLATVLAGVLAVVLAGSVAAGTGELGPDDLLVTTIPNDFYPAEADLSDCLSALPPPGCGSEAKGGWPQFIVFALIVAGLGVIAARIIVSARRNRNSAATEGAQPASRSEQNATEADTS